MTAPSGSFERLVLARGTDHEVSAAGHATYSADLKAVTGLEVYAVTIGYGSSGSITLPTADIPELIASLQGANDAIAAGITPPAPAYTDAAVDLANKAGDSIEDRRVNFERTTS